MLIATFSSSIFWRRGGKVMNVVEWACGERNGVNDLTGEDALDEESTSVDDD